MKVKSRKIEVGSFFNTNCSGLVEVINYESALKIEVKFLQTGFIRYCTARNLKAGEVKDKLAKSVHGVGYLGDGKHKARISGKETKTYSVWSGMIARCYCAKTQERHPAYIGCSVASEWHNFQDFAEWYLSNHPKDASIYELDKDLKVHGNRVYSPDTCLFISKEENAATGVIRKFRLVSPKGSVISGRNVLQFCKENNLTPSSIYGVLAGRLFNHQGWSAAND